MRWSSVQSGVVVFLTPVTAYNRKKEKEHLLMTDTTRTVLIALGISLMASVLVPTLVCVSAMMGMGDMTGMMPETMGGMGGRGMYWGVASALAILVAGAVLLALGLRRSHPPRTQAYA